MADVPAHRNSGGCDKGWAPMRLSSAALGFDEQSFCPWGSSGSRHPQPRKAATAATGIEAHSEPLGDHLHLLSALAEDFADRIRLSVR